MTRITLRRLECGGFGLRAISCVMEAPTRGTFAVLFFAQGVMFVCPSVRVHHVSTVVIIAGEHVGMRDTSVAILDNPGSPL